MRSASSRNLLLAALLTAAIGQTAPAALAQTPPAEPTSASPGETATRYRTVEIDGLEIFYREAGRRGAPAILMLHGFPASSFMYRDLLVLLSRDHHVIAPDYPGFGYSDAPSTQDFSYTFDRLADVMEAFTQHIGLERYALYMQDFGGPVGFRLAAQQPEKVSHLVIQNANAYEEGLPDDFWTPARTLWKDPSPANVQALREAAMSDTALAWNYTHGVRDAARVNPDSWVLQRALLARPGNKDAMMALLYDYRTNLEQYAVWHDYFRRHQPQTLIVWGRNDVIFPAEGARAYLKDLPAAELHLLDTGHFALEDKAGEIAQRMLAFLR